MSTMKSLGCVTHCNRRGNGGETSRFASVIKPNASSRDPNQWVGEAYVDYFYKLCSNINFFFLNTVVGKKIHEELVEKMWTGVPSRYSVIKRY